ncbi:MAG: hypothetical protein A3I44_06340 [Candidatus Sungbacteria bacterium RIFCSPLOWO2_02_FULL_51_17]|nr:MAG: hypothetical protein A3I44_06340 [Candidatus Sungbacteria bacterium RIFCSPLOWO2_02_FULL_51_17]
MNRVIDQTIERIDPHAILARQFSRAWFFTNERIEPLLERLPNTDRIQSVFGVAGSGDFALHAASRLRNVSRIDVSDVRPLALLTTDLKIALCRTLTPEDLEDVFRCRDSENAQSVYSAVREDVSAETRAVFDVIFENAAGRNFIRAIRKSGYWYPDGFRSVRRDAGYLPYLLPERSLALKAKIDTIRLHAGDFDRALSRFPDRAFDLVYVSNMFDSPRYCRDADRYLATIRAKLAPRGFVVSVTQHHPKKIERIFLPHGFSCAYRERHRFNILKAVCGDFDYSYLLFRAD